MVDSNVLGALACPKCRGGVKLNKMFITCRKCGLAFPVLENIPDMLLKDAWNLADARKAGFRHK